MTVKNELAALKIWETRIRNHNANLSQRDGMCSDTTSDILAASSVLSEWLKRSPANTRKAYGALMMGFCVSTHTSQSQIKRFPAKVCRDPLGTG